VKKKTSLKESLNFESFHKKGVSAVVATVLIILITVAAVAIIWTAITPMIDKLDSATVCFDTVSQLTVETKGYTCIQGDALMLQIGHGSADFDLADIQVLISSGGNTETINLVAGEIIAISSLPGINEKKTFTITSSDMTTLADDIESIAIAPVLKVGDSTEFCPVLASVEIKAC